MEILHHCRYWRGVSPVYFLIPGRGALIPEAGSYGNIDYRIVCIGKEPLSISSMRTIFRYSLKEEPVDCLNKEEK